MAVEKEKDFQGLAAETSGLARRLWVNGSVLFTCTLEYKNLGYK